MNETYGKRLHEAARREFKNFWSAYRNWVMFSTAVLSPLIIQITRHGWHSVINLDETLTNAVGGLIVSVIGTYLIAMRKGAENLDSALHDEIKQRDQTIHLLNAKPKRTPAEDHHFRQAEAELKKMSENEKMVARNIWTNGELVQDLNGRAVVLPLSAEQTMEALRKLTESSFIKRKQHSWEIQPGFKDILGELLFPSIVPP